VPGALVKELKINKKKKRYALKKQKLKLLRC
jgi:hypothetical protein